MARSASYSRVPDSGLGLHRLFAADSPVDSPADCLPLVASEDGTPRPWRSCSAQQRQVRKGVTGAIILALTFSVMVGLFASKFVGSKSGMHDVATPKNGKWPMAAAERSKCHTAVKGEHCHQDVQWAMTIGIRDHPEWYDESCPRLQPTGKFEEFQACVYRINKTSCPLPCNPKNTGAQEAAHEIITHRPEPPPKALNHVVQPAPAPPEPSPPAPAAPAPRAPCHIAKQGQCYDAIIKVMTGDFDANPDNFPGITKKSTFEDIQAMLHEKSDVCANPPCRCVTANEGNDAKCWGHVSWAMNEGIRAHPTWYDGLTVSSSFEEVQAFLHKDAKGTCQLPCSGVNWNNAKDNMKSEATAKIECNEVAWPDKYKGLVCGECKVVVERMRDHYEICGRFCQEIGRSCVGAWEETGEGCEPGKTKTCDEQINADRGICQCGDMLPASELEKLAASQPPPSDQESQSLDCRSAKRGSKCHDAITYAMTKGLFENPQWYQGLDQFSAFEDFQKVLNKNPDLECPKPCRCRTARRGEECYKNVQWVLKEGINEHPDWYPGMSETSRWEDVQARLHEDSDTTCEKPCSPKEYSNPSLYCVAVFRSTGYEVDLVRSQVDKGVGIFSCDEFAVLSDKELAVTDAVKTWIIPPCETVGVSKDGTAANTLIFMQMWSVVYDEARYKAHDWVLKADPDAVVLPDRIRRILATHTAPNVWITNCMKYEGPGWPMMFGSLEAFSVGALSTYYEGEERCRTDLEWQAWGEDLFMGNCLSLLGAESEFDGGLIGDEVCKGGDCSDGTTGAYHPYKDATTWFECYNTAMGL